MKKREFRIYKQTNRAFEDWLAASLNLARKTYSRSFADKLLLDEKPFQNLREDALAVMSLQREAAGIKEVMKP